MTNLIIGVRDSGVGGLTVARQIKKVLPHASLLYFADTAHVPYGDRDPREVRHFALSISQFLIAQGAQAIVFACNTSSAYALNEARRRFALPIFGMIEPGARAALQVSRQRRIGVLATQATVDSGVYTQWLTRLEPRSLVIEVACPRFVPLVESDRAHSQEAFDAAQKYFAPLRRAQVDAVVLGCTHFPLLLPALREVAPHVQFVDPAEAVADAVRAHFGHLTVTQAAPHDTFFVSGDDGGVRQWIDKLLPRGARPIDVQSGPVFDCPSPKSTFQSTLARC